MTELVLHHATYEDLVKVPDHLIAELIDGDLYTTPRHAIPHVHVNSALGGDLNVRFQQGLGGPGGWWILVEVQLRLVEDSLVPDISGWRHERLSALPDTATLDIVPDWICQVQSPGSARFNRVEKLPVYAKHGVRHAWLIDPTARTLEVLRLENGRWIVAGNYGSDDLVRVEPFDAVETELAALWT